MNRDVELERLRHENLLLRQAGAVKEEQMKLLKQENHSLQEALNETFQAVKQLQDQVKTLQEQQAKDSHNSHLPPSSDRFGKRQKSLRKSSGKNPGGQSGHQGHHLQPLEQVDEVVLQKVQECQHCHHSLESQPADIIERRQVIDLPPRCVWVTEHQIEEKCCPACGAATRAVFPDAVRATAQYGTRIQALGVYLIEGQMVPYARASQMLREVFGLQISAAFLASRAGALFDRPHPHFLTCNACMLVFIVRQEAAARMPRRGGQHTNDMRDGQLPSERTVTSERITTVVVLP